MSTLPHYLAFSVKFPNSGYVYSTVVVSSDYQSDHTDFKKFIWGNTGDVLVSWSKSQRPDIVNRIECFNPDDLSRLEDYFETNYPELRHHVQDHRLATVYSPDVT